MNAIVVDFALRNANFIKLLTVVRGRLHLPILTNQQLHQYEASKVGHSAVRIGKIE